VSNTLTSCIGWFLDISVERDQAIIWIKTEDKKILKLKDAYQPSFYILPRNKTDGLSLFQILSQQQDIITKISWEEDKFANVFDYSCPDKKKKLIYIQLQSTRCYTQVINKLEKDYRVKQFINTDLSHVQRYLFTKLRIEPTSKVKVEYYGSNSLK
jgi:hypothetical protein